MNALRRRPPGRGPLGLPPADAKLDELHRQPLPCKAPVLYHRNAPGAAIPLAEQEGEEHVSLPARHGQRLMQVGPGEHGYLKLRDYQGGGGKPREDTVYPLDPSRRG